MKIRKLRIAQELDLSKAFEGLSSEKLKAFKEDQTFVKHAKTIIDYYGSALLQLCNQVDTAGKKLNSDPVEVAMWSLGLPDTVVATYKALVKPSNYTQSEMLKWVQNQKEASFKRTALQAPKVEIDPSYNEVLKQEEFIKQLAVLPVTKKFAKQFYNQFVTPLLDHCKTVKEAQQNVAANPFTAITVGVELPAKLVAQYNPLVKQSDEAAKKFKDWIFKTKKQFESVDMGGGTINVKTNASTKMGNGCIYPNTAGGAVNYAAEAIKEVEANGSKRVTAEQFDKEAHQWIVLDHELRKAYLVNLLKCSHKPIDLKGRNAKVKTAKKTPKKFSISQKCLCDYFGMPCTGNDAVSFERNKDGWKVKGQPSPLSDDQVAALFSSCKK